MTEPPPLDPGTSQRLALGTLVLDLGRGELLTAAGELAGLRRQALDVLLLLGRRAGEVVGKDELMQQVWPQVVVGEGSLTQAISDIRRALGDHEHRLVRNVARRGYQLVPDGPGPAPAVPASAAQPDAPAAAPQASRPGRRPGPAALAAAALAVLLLALAGGWAWTSRAPQWVTPAELARAPLPRELPPLSVVVLPLAVEGGTVETGWLADALHGDLVVEVARMYDSHVIARDTAASYKGRAVDPRQVARELGVRHVVTGSLRQQGPAIRLSFALVDGESGQQRWAETFETDRTQLAQAVGDIAVAVERTLVGALVRATAERRAALAPEDVGADDLAIQGYALWYRGVSRDNVEQARALFDRAVALKPDSARSWAGVHFTTTNLLINSWSSDRSADAARIDEAVANLERLEPEGHYTHNARTVQFFLRRDWPGMLRQTSAHVERYRVPLAFGAHGVALILNTRFDDAVQPLERALRLSPRDPFRAEWQYRLALAHFGAGRYELARQWSQAAADLNPKLVWPPIHAAALHRLGESEAAQRAWDEHLQRHPGFGPRQILARMPGDLPAYVEMRERLLQSLRALGMAG